MSVKPDYHHFEEFQNRTKKLQEIREYGVDPYPHKFTPTGQAETLHQQYESNSVGTSEEAAAGKTPFVSLAGRLVLFRSMGKNAFAHIEDDTGRIQLMFNVDLTQVEGYLSENRCETQPMSPYKFIEKKLDLGDWIGVEGHLFRTMKQELTLYVKKLTLLCKSLLPLADKHSGLADKELRYRKRWLDLIANPEIKATFLMRSLITRSVRQYFETQGFLEVETPVIQACYGGAQARPFKTVLNALNQEMFLRISLEIPLKKLIVGGLPRIFEIGKVFRNEGIDRTHNPEFTELEAYAAFWDYNDMMVLVENLFEKLAIEFHGSTKIKVTPEGGEPIEIEMKAPWKRMSMQESIKHYAGIDIEALDEVQMCRLLEERADADPLILQKLSRGLLIAEIFSLFVEPILIQPHHIIDHPVETTPLCKPHREAKWRSKGYVERFETFICGQEICNSYSELNDPELQRLLLEEQARKKDAGDEEANPLDEEFIEAICQGMPPAGGLGIGMDRLIMLFTNCSSIRDVLYFPWMKNPSISVEKSNQM